MVVHFKQAGKRNAVTAFTLLEVMIGFVIFGLVITGMIYGYVQANRMAEWSSQSLAAMSYASQGMEQMRSAQWCAEEYSTANGQGTTDVLPITNQPDGTWGFEPIRLTHWTFRQLAPDLRHELHLRHAGFNQPAAEATRLASCVDLPADRSIVHQHHGYPARPRPTPMKLFKNIQNRARRRNVRGFTLVEMVITVGVFLFIFTGVMDRRSNFRVAHLYAGGNQAGGHRRWPPGAESNPGPNPGGENGLCRELFRSQLLFLPAHYQRRSRSRATR